MKRRSNILTLAAVSILTLSGASSLRAAEAPLPSPTPAEETNDSVISGATKSVIETFGELSRTATKLSETALKLLKAQEEIDKRGGSGTGKVYIEEEYIETPPQKEVAPRRDFDLNADTPRRVYIETEAVHTECPEPEEEEYTGPRVFISDGQETTEAKDSTDIPTLNSIWDLQPAELDGGRYIWVPDGQELRTRGNTRSLEPDLTEKTYWRGDSIAMAIPTKRYGRYDRKLYNWLIYPKGQWHLSLSANYGDLTTEDTEILSLMKDIDIHGKIYSIKPAVSYFFKSNICAGIRLAFTKGELGIDSFKVDIDEDMNFNLHDIKYSSDSYAAAIFLQQHFGLSRRGRFSVYNELELAYGMGNKHFVRPFDGEMKDTRTKTQNINISYSPGVSILVMKNAAFNLSFGILGFKLQHEKQWENGEQAGERLTSGINFKFNIFNINFGVSIVI